MTPTAAATGTNPPAKPTTLQAAAASDAVTLTWTTSTDQTVTHYAILRRNADARGVFHVIESNAGPGTSYTDRTVAAASRYNYRVKAVSPTGVSSWSGYVKIDTPATTPGAPTLSTGIATSFSIVLSWSAPADDGGSAVTGYELEYSADAGDTWQTLVEDTATTETEYTHSELEPETTRHYRVSAINEHGAGLSSAAVAFTTLAAPPGLTPATLESTLLGYDEEEGAGTLEPKEVTFDADATFRVTSVSTWPGVPGLVLVLTAGNSTQDAALADTDFILEADETVLVVGTTEFSFDDAVLSHSDTTGDNAEYTGDVLVTWTAGQAGLVAGETVAFRLERRDRPDEPQFQSVNTAATGLPRIVVSAESPGILAADTWDIRDADGLPYGLTPSHPEVGGPDDGQFTFDFSYQWIRVDGANETNVGTDSQRYQLVEADIGKKFKVQVSFTDRAENAEAVTSVPFGPIARPTLLSPSSLVSNTGQSPSATAMITSEYAMKFNLGDHGQGYEISSVSIDLAAVPSSLSVSLWTGGPPGSSGEGSRRAKLFEFVNPDPFAVGLNEFTAPLGVHALQAVDHWIVLSGFGSSLSIEETTSDDEDVGGETGAALANEAGGDTSVVRLAINGSRRTQGILAANLAQPNSEGNQEIISVGDNVAWTIALGDADRFLVRGVSFSMDNTTSLDGGMDNPWHFRSDNFSGTIHFRMFLTRNVNGLPTFTAPQGATVSGESTYALQKGIGSELGFVNDGKTIERIGAVLSRTHHVDVAVDGRSDAPTGAGTTLGKGGALSGNDAAGPTPHMAVYGVPLYTVVKNLGQTDNGYVSVGGTNDVVSQGFTTGSGTGGYSFQGIGVNIEGSALSGTSQVPADASAVSVSVHADSSGQPGAKLFDLLSPTEYAAGHSFFEAPRGTRLDASTSYVLVWHHNSGANHRLVKTTGNSEDSGGEPGASIADAFRLGPDVANLTQDSGGNALEITVYSGGTPPNATGRPVILPTAEDHGVLAVDTSPISDPEGIPNVGSVGSTGVLHNFRYRWIRVDGTTETVVGADQIDYRQLDSAINALGVRIESGRYRLTEEDAGKLLRVEVSFFDNNGAAEVVSSLPFRPVREPPRALPAATLVSNTRQSLSATATIDDTAPYRVGFKLGVHGQGYDISGVSIDLAAVPDRLRVSLWVGRSHGSGVTGAHTKLFEFENPESFRVGLNEFKAPPAAFVYQNLEYFIELSGFGDSLSIKETASDDEDAGGEPGATIADGEDSDDEDSGVLRLAVKGHRRDHGILVSTYGQNPTKLHQEIVSQGDNIGIKFTVGEADRYLIRGATFSADNTASGGGFTSPWLLRDGTDELFKLFSTRQINGINEFTAPQGMTVEGGCTTLMSVETCEEYNIYKDKDLPLRQGGVILTRYHATDSTDEDAPKAAGVSIGTTQGDFDLSDAMSNPVRAFMAIFGEPLNAMVQNLGQTDGSWRSVGGTNPTTASQGFTAGSNEFGYRLKGIAVNIEGSDDSNGDPQVPDGPASVLVSVHANSGGRPGAKLFDLISPVELGAGDRFFEAPPRTYLDPDTSYHLVWRHTGGTPHRLQLTDTASEDSGALTGASIADEFRRGSVREQNKALEIAVYTDVLTKGPPVAGGLRVNKNWRHIPEGIGVGDQFRLLFVTHRGRLPLLASGDIEEYNTWVREEAEEPYSQRLIRDFASEFKAVVCTAAVNAKENTDMEGVGVPIHWLDGGWQDRPTLVAKANTKFYGPEWENTEYGARVTGNSFYFGTNAKVWTGCDAFGEPLPSVLSGTLSLDKKIDVGRPNDSRDANNAPLGPVDTGVDNKEYEHEFNVVIKNKTQERLLPLYAISPVFTVVETRSEQTKPKPDNAPLKMSLKPPLRTAKDLVPDPPPPPVPLTAAFAALPAEHDGTRPVTFTLIFSAPPRLSATTLREQAFTVTGGTMQTATQQGSTQRWTITVQPTGDDDVTVRLAGGRACGTKGAICTADGRVLSNGVAMRVLGPLTGTEDDATLSGTDSADVLYGSHGADTLSGGGGPDELYGDGDPDSPGSGNDTLDGGTSDDLLDGAAGEDTLMGGAGADTFVFAPGHGTDTISDFSPEEEDLIDLTAFATLTGFAALTLTADGDDTVLDLSAHQGGTVRLEGIAPADLEAEDFELP